MTSAIALDEALRGQLATTLEETALHVPGVTSLHRGKVRDSYRLPNEQRLIVTTDRISAFDQILGTLPCKGQVLNQLAAHWFQASRAVAPNHMIAAPDPNLMVVRDCSPLPVELVMRGYLTGVTSTSIWVAYQRGERRFAGHALPEGMRKNEPLPRPLLTPSTKAEKGGHDETLSADELLRRGLLDAETLALAQGICARLFAFGQAQARARGLILVDTKYELGWAAGPDGRRELLVIDEVHTPDSSRYWFAADYEARLAAGEEPRALDKEFVRRHLVARGYAGAGPPPPGLLDDAVRVEAARRYIEAYELLTGQHFVPALGDARPRLTLVVAALAQEARETTPGARY